VHILRLDGFEWDPAKAASNLRKHGVSFADAAVSLSDPHAVTITDPDAQEERYIALAASPAGVLLVTVYCYVVTGIRIISSRRASPGERKSYEEP
jgi:uncharacterized protein